jgi:hypothetical protein
MPNSEITWEAQVLEAIDRAAGAKAADALEAQWSQHTALKPPVVTLFGSYDSGKSTMLKRLLVEAGVVLPEWLTIAARRDTYEVNEVEAFGCLFRDTPGIASGNPEHERAAREALTTTDVILVLLPPQLVTGDREAILAVVSGEVFRSGGIRLGEALALAMCKMDEGTYDPQDDPIAYAQYIHDKRQELLAILERARIDVGPEKIFGVAADPFQTVINAKNPGRSVYDSFREWDGIAALIEWLSALPSSLKALRALARKRFLCAAAEAHRTALVRRIGDVELGLQETTANEERFALIQQQLGGLLKQARAALDAMIEEELHTAAHARLDDQSAISTFVEPRLKNAAARWWEDQSADLDALIESTDAEVQARAESLGEKKARRLFEESAGEHGSQYLPNKKIVLSLAEKAQVALRKHHEGLLGMKLEKAREELRKIDETKTFGAYLENAKRRKAFRSLGEVERARKIVAFHTVVGTVGPAILELGSLFWEEKQRTNLEKKRAERRQQLRDMIRQVAGEIGKSTWDDWEVPANEFKNWLLQRESAAKAMSETLDEELRNLTRSRDEFARLLAHE